MTNSTFDFLYKSYCELIASSNMKIFCAGIVGLYSIFLGATDPSIVYAVMILVGIDFITGISASKLQGNVIKSNLAFRTPLKAFFYLLMIIAAHQVGILVPTMDIFLIGAMSGYLGVNELISVIENFGRMGYKVPMKILNQLEEMNK